MLRGIDPILSPNVLHALRAMGHGDVIALAEAHCDIQSIERFAFYEIAKSAFSVIQTGEQRLYGNILLSMGVIG